MLEEDQWRSAADERGGEELSDLPTMATVCVDGLQGRSGKAQAKKPSRR